MATTLNRERILACIQGRRDAAERTRDRFLEYSRESFSTGMEIADLALNASAILDVLASAEELVKIMVTREEVLKSFHAHLLARTLGFTFSTNPVENLLAQYRQQAWAGMIETVEFLG